MSAWSSWEGLRLSDHEEDMNDVYKKKQELQLQGVSRQPRSGGAHGVYVTFA